MKLCENDIIKNFAGIFKTLFCINSKGLKSSRIILSLLFIGLSHVLNLVTFGRGLWLSAYEAKFFY